jgi:UDP-N-acetylmuramoylalanine--D-glutamate ligase
MNSNSQCVLVLGVGASGRAAARLAAAHGASVTLCDTRPEAALADEVAALRAEGFTVLCDRRAAPPEHFHLAVAGPGLSPTTGLYRSVKERRIPLLGELEFGWRLARRHTVAVTGTNGKTTTTELITHVLNAGGLPAKAAGNIGLPVSELARDPSLEAYGSLVLEVSSFQLEEAKEFRPEISVMLNLTPDHLDRHGDMAEYARVKARIFRHQRAGNLTVIQTEALAYLRSLGVNLSGRIVTFSATSPRADLHYDDGLIASSLPDWQGPLLALQQTRLRGAHNAENVMATLAVGRELGLRLEDMVRAIKTFQPGAHRYEIVGECNGVTFVNDSKATNLDAMMKAVEATPAVTSGETNIVLIAGGSAKGVEYYEAGPLLARRAKAAVLIGASRDNLREAWSLFTPCHLAEDLEDAVRLAVELAEPGDVVLLSPACSSFDQFIGYTQRGELFKAIVEDLSDTTYGAPLWSSPTRDSGTGKTSSNESKTETEL